MNEHASPFAPRLALAGLGLSTYWPQFAGLHERLLGYHARIAAGLTALGAQVQDLGLVFAPVKLITKDNLPLQR